MTQSVALLRVRRTTAAVENFAKEFDELPQKLELGGAEADTKHDGNVHELLNAAQMLGCEFRGVRKLGLQVRGESIIIFRWRQAIVNLLNDFRFLLDVENAWSQSTSATADGRSLRNGTLHAERRPDFHARSFAI